MLPRELLNSRQRIRRRFPDCRAGGSNLASLFPQWNQVWLPGSLWNRFRSGHHRHALLRSWGPRSSGTSIGPFNSAGDLNSRGPGHQLDRNQDDHHSSKGNRRKCRCCPRSEGPIVCFGVATIAPCNGVQPLDDHFLGCPSQCGWFVYRDHLRQDRICIRRRGRVVPLLPNVKSYGKLLGSTTLCALGSEHRSDKRLLISHLCPAARISRFHNLEIRAVHASQ